MLLTPQDLNAVLRAFVDDLLKECGNAAIDLGDFEDVVDKEASD